MKSVFQQELNEFEKHIITSWFKETGNKIGLSIQIDNEVQDSQSTTRDTKACDLFGVQHNLINAFCAKVLENSDNISLCNGLDFHLKKIVKDNEAPISIGCRCHMGISNFIIPYRYKDRDPTFYIFIGQFLAKPLKEKDFKTYFTDCENFEFLSNKNISDFQQKYLKAGPFVKKNVADSFTIGISDVGEQNGRVEIAYVSMLEFIAYKKYVVDKFENWIAKYFIERNPSWKFPFPRYDTKDFKLGEKLRSFVAHESVESILYDLEISKSIESKRHNYENRLVIDNLESYIIENKSTLKDSEVTLLKEFSLLHTNPGIFNSPNYKRKGDELLKLLTDEKDTGNT